MSEKGIEHKLGQMEDPWLILSAIQSMIGHMELESRSKPILPVIRCKCNSKESPVLCTNIEYKRNKNEERYTSTNINCTSCGNKFNSYIIYKP